MPTNHTPRCAGCGEEIEPGGRVVRLQEGTFAEDFKAAKKGQIVYLHKTPCYGRAVSSPRLVLEEIRRHAKVG